MDLRHPFWRIETMRARAAVAVLLLGAAVVVIVERRMAEKSPPPPPRTFETAGMSLTAPQGWSGRAAALDRHHGAPLVEVRGGGIRVRAMELGNRPGGRRFPVVALPIAFRKSDLLAARLLRPGQAAAVKTFAVRGRSFVVDAEFPERTLPGVLDEANEVLATLRIDRAPGSDARTRARLSRPLHLPRASGDACPRSKASLPAPRTSWALGRGPAYPVLGRKARPSLRDDIVKDGWYLHKTLWAIAPAYRGPLLVRGRRIDAPGVIRFGTGVAEQMHWPGAWPGTSGWRYVPSTTAVRGAGCYALQLDGARFSRVVVFEAQLD